MTESTEFADDTRELVIDEHVAPRSSDPRILITNDDGIESPGIEMLAMNLSEEFETVVVAPAWDMSGSGTGIGHIDPTQGVALTKQERAEFEAYTIAGPPGLAVLAAMLGGFGPKPDLVVSGVNAGLNTGRSVLHSGTVGAALTARTFGIPGLAVSLEQSEHWHWETAVTVARSAVRWMLAHQGPPCVLNVNAPARPLGEVSGIHWADLDEFGHIRVAMADVPGERLEFDVSGSGAGLDPACDTALALAGNVTLTMLSPMNPAPFPPEAPTAVWSPFGETPADSD